MSDEQTDILLTRHLDGSTSAEESAALSARVAADPAVARALLDAAADELSFHDALAARPAATTSGPVAPAVAGRASEPASDSSRWYIGPRRWVAAAAAALAVAAGTWALLSKNNPAPVPVAAVEQPTALPARAVTVAAVGPGLTIDRAGAPAGQAVAGATLAKTDRLRTAPGGGAAVAFADDGSQVRLAGSSVASVYVETGPGGGKRVDVVSGAVTCDVAKQSPDHPFVVLTPAGRVQVVGTRFTVRSAGAVARVEVEHGTVRVTRAADGATVDVSAGEFVALGPAGASRTPAAAFPPVAGKDMGAYWSTAVRPAGISD
ncbi:MAG TPA: FecR family protein [Humisphaera sp.]